MSKVIRAARISDRPVVLPIHADPGMVELPGVSEGADPSGETSFTPMGERLAAFEENQADDFIAVEREEPGVLGLDEPEPEPGFSQDEVDAIIKERLDEAEVRLQRETARARQTGFDEGHAKGIEEGYANGLAEGQTQSKGEIARFQAMLAALAERWDDVIKTADLDLTQVALAVARNIIGAAADAHGNLVIDAVRDCLDHLQDKSRITIRIHPDDLELIRANRTKWRQKYEQIDTLNIEADYGIARGGCLVETPSGDIDAQIESRLDKLRTALVEAIRNAPSEQPPEIAVSQEENAPDDEAVTAPDESDESATPDLESDSEAADTESDPPPKGEAQ